MQISNIVRRVDRLKQLISDRDENITKLQQSVNEIEEKIKNVDNLVEEEKEKLAAEANNKRDELNEQEKKLKELEEELSSFLEELMKYRVVREIFEKHVKNEIEGRVQDISAVNNLFQTFIKDQIKDLGKKIEAEKDEDIDIYSIIKEYSEWFKGSTVLEDLKVGKTEPYKELCEFLNDKDKDKSKDIVEKYKDFKAAYDIIYNYKTYNETVNASTKNWYLGGEREKISEKYNSTIDQLIENKMPEIEKMAEEWNNNLNLQRGIERYFNIYTEEKQSFSVDTKEEKIELIKHIIKSYAKIDVRQDMGKRRKVLEDAVVSTEKKIKELQKEYGESREEKEIKEDNNEKNKEQQKVDNLKTKTQNTEKSIYTVRISQDELSKILQMRQNEEKKEENENRSKTFFNSIKEMYKKFFSKKEDIEEQDVEGKDKDEGKLETKINNKQENIEKPDVEEKDKDEEKTEIETENKQKEEPLKEFNGNEQRYLNDHPEMDSWILNWYEDQIIEVANERTKKSEQLKDDAKSEKEQDHQDEIEI